MDFGSMVFGSGPAIVVRNEDTGEVICRISESITMCRIGYSVKSENADSNVPTEALIRELASRTNVELYNIQDDEDCIIEANGPGQVMIINKKK